MAYEIISIIPIIRGHQETNHSVTSGYSTAWGYSVTDGVMVRAKLIS